MNRATDPRLFPTTTGLLMPDGRYAVRQLCQGLGVEPAELARLTGRSTESVAKLFGSQPTKPREIRTLRVLRELLQLHSILDGLGLSGEEMKGWMHAPLPAFDGKTARDVIEEGHGQELIARLTAYSSGNVPA
jgi:hypothetical protein